MDGGKVCMHMQSQCHTRFGSGPLPSLLAAQGFQDFLLNLVVPRSVTRWKTVHAVKLLKSCCQNVCVTGLVCMRESQGATFEKEEHI